MMGDRSEVVLRLDLDRRDHSKVVRVGVKRANGTLHWVCEWLCGQAVNEHTLNESAQVAEDLWARLVATTVGIQSPLL